MLNITITPLWNLSIGAYFVFVGDKISVLPTMSGHMRPLLEHSLICKVEFKTMRINGTLFQRQTTEILNRYWKYSKFFLSKIEITVDITEVLEGRAGCQSLTETATNSSSLLMSFKITDGAYPKIHR